MTGWPIDGLSGLPLVSVTTDVAERLTGISAVTIRQAAKGGALKAHMNGSRYVIRWPDLDEWVNSLPAGDVVSRGHPYAGLREAGPL
ncbi:MAG: helix-turn-helix domain-containing protein [Propionibacteriaceae bacterium]|jgi:excisionase family DNA binding protein|nr:helix-turn-helix domain-containing protein [Propionibacteriaceae bacterium]